MKIWMIIQNENGPVQFEIDVDKGTVRELEDGEMDIIHEARAEIHITKNSATQFQVLVQPSTAGKGFLSRATANLAEIVVRDR